MMEITKGNLIKSGVVGTNLFDPNDPDRLVGKMLNADGTLFSNGSYNTTGYIKCKKGDFLCTSRASGSYMLIRAYAFYDEDKVWNSGASVSSPELLPYINAVIDGYARISYVYDNVNFKVEYGVDATTYEAYAVGNILDKNIVKIEDSEMLSFNPWRGKTEVVNGDSIAFGTAGASGNYTNQKGWAVYTANTLGMVLKNHAIGGSTIAVKEASPAERTPIVTRYTDMTDGDLVIIAGGSNDHEYDWTPLGDMTSRTNFTFYGALHNLCLGLLEKYTGKQILFLTPIKRGQHTQEYINANGKTLKEYGDIIKEVCHYYGIPVLDMYNECIINPHITTQATLYIPDLVHPNRAGHEIMGKKATGYIRQLA